MSLDSLQKLLIQELKDLYNAEKQLVQALPKLAKAASDPDLAAAFREHHQQTEGHVRRLEEAFESLGTKPAGKKCKGMEGVIAEGQEMLADDGDPAVKDAALIASAQRAEHYEIAAYGCVRNYAELLGLDDVAELLDQTLAEEEATDEKLTQLAEGGINAAAVSAGSEE
jgi:ferritin-like metal-binding protein YciE